MYLFRGEAPLAEFAATRPKALQPVNRLDTAERALSLGFSFVAMGRPLDYGVGSWVGARVAKGSRL